MAKTRRVSMLSDRSKTQRTDTSAPKDKSSLDLLDLRLRLPVLRVLDREHNLLSRDFLHSAHIQRVKMPVVEGDSPGIDDHVHVIPRESLLGVLRDLLRVGIEDMVPALNDMDGHLTTQDFGELRGCE